MIISKKFKNLKIFKKNYKIIKIFLQMKFKIQIKLKNFKIKSILQFKLKNRKKRDQNLCVCVMPEIVVANLQNF